MLSLDFYFNITPKKVNQPGKHGGKSFWLLRMRKILVDSMQNWSIFHIRISQPQYNSSVISLHNITEQ